MTAAFLMYHEVETPERAPVYRDPGYVRYVIDEETFRSQLDWLTANQFRGVSVGEALDRHDTHLRTVALTFDDGCESDAEVAAPLLADHGFNGTFYVVTDWIARPGFMSATQIRRLAAAGFEIGSHSASHRFLSDLDAAELRRELVESRQRLEEITGQPVVHLSCPGGRHNALVARAAREAGYETMATSRIGLNAPGNLYGLNRIAIYRDTRLTQFAAACQGRIAARRLKQRTLDAAKRMLGNGAYVALRDGLLGRRT